MQSCNKKVLIWQFKGGKSLMKSFIWTINLKSLVFFFNFSVLCQCFSASFNLCLSLCQGGEEEEEEGEEGWPRRDGWWVRCCQTGGVKGQRILWFSITLLFSPVTVMAVCLWSFLLLSFSPLLKWFFLFTSSVHPLLLSSWLTLHLVFFTALQCTGKKKAFTTDLKT